MLLDLLLQIHQSAKGMLLLSTWLHAAGSALESQPLASPFHSPGVQIAPEKPAPSSGPNAAAAPGVTAKKAGSKRRPYTACALAVLGLQHLPGMQGTGKEIVSSLEAAPELAAHLNR